MHSIKFIRENKELIKNAILKKKCDIDLDGILGIDFKRRTLIQEVETLKAERNTINNKVSLRKKEKEDYSSLINEMKNISIKIKALDNDLNDFNNYPNTLETDIKILSKTNCKMIFAPSKKEIYPLSIKTEKVVFKYRDILCDLSRSGHFDGVTTIVAKLFNIIQPTHAFFGCKDIQQLIIIKKLVEDLNYNIKILSGKTIRNKLGVALSSRNQYLSNTQLMEASKIYQSLKDVKKIIDTGNINIQYLKKYRYFL